MEGKQLKTTLEPAQLASPLASTKHCIFQAWVKKWKEGWRYDSQGSV
jgi:hypothetical protein